MWTRPTRPPSSWMNAPYGVIRCTVPSTTAPTSRSAIASSSRSWDEAPSPRDPARGSGTIPSGPGGVNTHRNVAKPGEADRSAGRRLGRSVLRNDDERHLARLHHPQALPGQLLDVAGVVVLADL